MLSSICKVLIRSTVLQSIHNVRFGPFSSLAPNSSPGTVIDNHLISNYLVSTFGFSQNKALLVSKYLKLDSTKKPELIHAFLEKRGFTANQIRCAVRLYPHILRYDINKKILPTIKYFESSGFSQTEVNNIILKAPAVLVRSLENQIMPCFNYVRSLFDSTNTTVTFSKQLAQVLCCNLESRLIPHIEVLRGAGVPDSRIVMMMQSYPRILMADTQKFRKVVNEVSEMNLSPGMFSLAAHTLMVTSKLTWEKKVAVYKKWGFSETDVRCAFQKQPSCMLLSTDKITAIMNFLVNDLGIDYSSIVRWPKVLSYSLEKRLKTRYSVYKILVEKGLIKEVSSLFTVFNMTEKFLREDSASLWKGSCRTFAVLSENNGCFKVLSLLID